MSSTLPANFVHSSASSYENLVEVSKGILILPNTDENSVLLSSLFHTFIIQVQMEFVMLRITCYKQLFKY